MINLGTDPRAPWVVFRDKPMRARIDAARYWLRNVGRPYPPIEIVRAMAVFGLNSNPTITAYTFENGVEHRHDANPFTKVMAAFAQLADQMNKSTDRLRDFFQALADHANASRKGNR